MPRICMFLESYHPVVGGMETQARTLAAGLTELGIEVLFITRRTGPELERTGVVDGCRVVRVGPSGRSSRLRWALAFTALPTLIKHRREYDIIFVPGLRALGLTALLVARLLGKKAILKGESCGELSGEFFRTGLKTAKLKLSSGPVKLALALRNKLAARADAFVSMSTEMTEEFTSCGVPAGRIYVIPQTIDTERFKPPADEQERKDIRARLKLPKTGRIILYTGRLVSYKGIPLLVEAWEKLMADYPEDTLVIVGCGGVDVYNCEDALHEYVAKHQMSERVLFTGAVGNVEDYLKAGDLFAFPTENEAFGISLIEAMACRLPVIGTLIGGIPDILEDGVNGLLIEAGSEPIIREALNRLLQDNELSQGLAQTGYETAQNRYTRPNVARQYLTLFNTLLAQE